jgi:transcriptional regulator with XRE-family HTH domain
VAIPAHFEQAAVDDRRAPRGKLWLDTQGTSASGKTSDVLVHNISPTGLLIECSAQFSPGETIEIELPQVGGTAATVVWTSGRLCGCQFDQPISDAALGAARLSSVVDDGVDLSPPQLPSEPFGSRLERLRKARGLTLAQVAAQLDVSKPTVWAWEKERARPLDDRMEDLAHVLGVPSSDLVTGQDSAAVQSVVARCRDEIARACGASPDKIRISIEL